MGGLLFGALAITGLVVARQVTVMAENLRLLADLHTLATTDSLTGLPNRHQFYTLMGERFGPSQSPGGCVVLVDLDDCDAVLVAAGERPRAAVRPGDAVARLGGDEFALLVPGVRTEDEAVAAAARVVAAVELPFAVRGVPVRVAASIGIALSGDPADAPEDLLRRADLAMYAAKREGKGRYRVYRPDTTARYVDARPAPLVH